MTNGEFVSRVVGMGRFTTKDDRISRRLVLLTGRSKVSTYISRELDNRTLFRDESLFTHLGCVEMVSDNIVDCDIVEFKRCKSLMKSKKPIEGIVYSRFGDSLVSVQSIDGGTVFSRVSPSSWANRTRRKYSGLVSSPSYFVKDGFLYLPDSNVKMVSVTVLTLDPSAASEASSCTDSNNCKSLWDEEFIVPDKYLELILAETLQEVLRTYRQLVPDQNPDLDETQRGKTVN